MIEGILLFKWLLCKKFFVRLMRMFLKEFGLWLQSPRITSFSSIQVFMFIWARVSIREVQIFFDLGQLYSLCRVLSISGQKLHLGESIFFIL